MNHEELTLGTVSVASPVFDADQTVVAALSIVGRSIRVDPRRLGPAVRMAALGISRENRERAVRPTRAVAARLWKVSAEMVGLTTAG